MIAIKTRSVIPALAGVHTLGLVPLCNGALLHMSTAKAVCQNPTYPFVVGGLGLCRFVLIFAFATNDKYNFMKILNALTVLFHKHLMLIPLHLRWIS